MVRVREVDRPLRRDVRFLGKLLGEVLVEQEGRALFELEERVRQLAILRRRGPPAGRKQAAEELAALLAALPLSQAEPVIRAFSAYFGLVNLAEQHHRIRRARAHAAAREPAPQRGSVAAVLLAAREAGVPAARVRQALATLEVTLTLTAHPTQAVRRTVLEKLDRIARRLEERDRCRLTGHEQAAADAAIREEITALWQTDEIRRERPTVGDEVKNVLWYVEEILWGAALELPHVLEAAFARAYGEPLGIPVAPLKLHSWVGGDMDGHPGVTPEVLADAMRAHQARGLRRLLVGVEELGGALSQSERHVQVPPALLASVEEDALLMPQLAARERSRTRGEPFRRKLRFVEARLAATLAEVEARRKAALPADRLRPHSEDGSGVPYRGPAELIADLSLLADSLRDANGAQAGERRLRALLQRVRTGGFHVAELELRVPAEDARHASAFLASGGPATPGATRLLEALRRIARAQDEGGEGACRTLILSMTESAADLLAALRCARAAGLWDEARGCARLDLVPLFERLEDLDASPAVLRELFADPLYRRHLEARGVQEVMVGYSDSGRLVGLLAAAGALRRAQVALPAIAREAGVALRIFHGRGESVARGGGPAQQAILALPAGSVAGRYKATEQGEALDHKYARPELALRTLELIAGGVLLHGLDAQDQAPAADEPRYVEAFDRLAELGRRAYRSLVWEEPRFVEFFSTATPIAELSRLPIGSRPSKRQTGGLEALRAIPWVFAWTQNRSILPGWYGIGSALEAFAVKPADAALLREMAERWPFFRTVLDNVEMVLAKADLAIAARYATLAPAAARQAVWPRIRAEHQRTRRLVLQLTGARKLLDGNLPLQRSISLRNPYVDPLSFLQVELLRRRRTGEQGCDRPLLLTVNGIAAGMRNTG